MTGLKRAVAIDVRGLMKRDVVFIGLAFVVLAIALSIYAIFEYTDVFPPTKRGFFCDDQTIRYPRHDSTYPGWAVLVVFFIVPAVVFTVVEGLIANRYTACYTLIHFSFAFCMSGLLCDSIKAFVGRLRPYFIALCLPGDQLNYYCESTMTMTAAAAANKYIEYVKGYNCTKDADIKELNKARKSFQIKFRPIGMENIGTHKF